MVVGGSRTIGNHRDVKTISATYRLLHLVIFGLGKNRISAATGQVHKTSMSDEKKARNHD